MKTTKDNGKKPLKIIHSSTPLRINDIGGWTDTWFSGEGKDLNMAISPLVEVQIKVFENEKKKEARVLVHAENFDETLLVNPEEPRYDKHPLLQGAINSLFMFSLINFSPLRHALNLQVFSQSRI